MHQPERFMTGAGNQYSISLGGEALGDGGDLLRSLAKTKDNLWEPSSECAMVVQLGKPYIFVGEMIQLCQS